MATRNTAAYASLSHAASIETPLSTGLNTRYSPQATTTSSATTTNRLTMPIRNRVSDCAMSVAVATGSPRRHPSLDGDEDAEAGEHRHQQDAGSRRGAGLAHRPLVRHGLRRCDDIRSCAYDVRYTYSVSPST